MGADQAVPGEVPEHQDQAGLALLRRPEDDAAAGAVAVTTPPDVVQANNGRSDMGEFVKAGQLVPLDDYAEAYDWGSAVSGLGAAVLALQRRRQDLRRGQPVRRAAGRRGGRALLQQGEADELGVQPPKTWAEFEDALAKAKAAGEMPMQFGNLDKWPAIHVFGTVQDQFVPADQITHARLRPPGASWNTPENTQGRRDAGRLGRQGLLQPRLQRPGTTTRPGRTSARATGVFLVAGTWLLADCRRRWATTSASCCRRGESATPSRSSPAAPVCRSPSPTRAKNPDAAAAYIDFITSPDAMKLLTSDRATCRSPTPPRQQAGRARPADVFTLRHGGQQGRRWCPYLDYATPTIYDTHRRGAAGPAGEEGDTDSSS